MTVKELLEQLQYVDPEAEVRLGHERIVRVDVTSSGPVLVGQRSDPRAEWMRNAFALAGIRLGPLPAEWDA